MDYKIKNREHLLSHGDIESRKIVLDIAELTLQELDAGKRIKSIMSLDGDHLHVGTKSWDLTKKKNIYIIGAGKACNHMIMAVEEILGNRITDGIAIVKILESSDEYKKTRVFVGGHPLPNETGLMASREVLKLVDQASADDLFICLFSGGSSALMSLPVPGITLQDEIETTDVLLKSGANIHEINAIRRHISQMNGGRLAQRINQVGAELIGFNISDSISNPPTDNIGVPVEVMNGTPIGADQTTLHDALQVIEKYSLGDRLPARVIDYLTKCAPFGETPKSFSKNTYFMLNTLPDSCAYAKVIAEKMGLSTLILTTFLEGESRDVGTVFASIAREIQTYQQPIEPPCVILSAGETTTRITNNDFIKGHGGPSQELTASFAVGAAHTEGACMFSIDSEGTDGTSIAAGGITDSKSYATANEMGIDLHKALREHATYEVLQEIGDAVLTGNTGTNVCDINIMYVPALNHAKNN